MLPDLTVKEVLTYVARLKFLDDNQDADINERVRRFKLLGLMMRYIFS